MSKMLGVGSTSLEQLEHSKPEVSLLYIGAFWANTLDK
jgi:hypothetical protein